uniref:cDNA6 protein n=1 Tax=Brugia pahangi TaxID=6280 RepID=Q17265_BRUPA|nr:cDNA6 [Brugia pahangi]
MSNRKTESAPCAMLPGTSNLGIGNVIPSAPSPLVDADRHVDIRGSTYRLLLKILQRYLRVEYLWTWLLGRTCATRWRRKLSLSDGFRSLLNEKDYNFSCLFIIDDYSRTCIKSSAFLLVSSLFFFLLFLHIFFFFFSLFFSEFTFIDYSAIILSFIMAKLLVQYKLLIIIFSGIQ